MKRIKQLFFMLLVLFVAAPPAMGRDMSKKANVDVKDIGGKYEINIQIENDKRILIDDIESTIRERHIDFKIKKVKFKSSENNPQ